MKDTIYSFKRTEMKFLLTPYQYAALLREIENNIKPDDYPESHIENIYYDTPTDYLIRTSLEKPVYKEKLRLRTYGCRIPPPRPFSKSRRNTTASSISAELKSPTRRLLSICVRPLQPELMAGLPYLRIQKEPPTDIAQPVRSHY